MSKSILNYRVLILAAAIGLSNVSYLAMADGPTTAPSQAAAPSTAPSEAEQLTRQFREVRKEIGTAIGEGEAFTDAKLRPDVAAKLVPLYAKLDEVSKKLAVARPKIAEQLAAMHDEEIETLAALDVQNAKDQLEVMAKSPDTEVKGKTMQLDARWMQVADTDDATQAKIVDDAEPLAKAHPEAEELTGAMAGWSQNANAPALQDRIIAIAGAMKNEQVGSVDQAREMIADIRKMKEMEGKPLVITGTTPDGKTFSSADYKGKVVLVDFWATWCGPCVAGLPKVKETYEQFHSAGLEIVGVSNDYDPNKLTTFTKEQNMPWVQLYDSSAGSQQQWNPTTLGFGIHGIPHMFVIGRDGKLISSNARSTYPKLIKSAVDANS